MRNRTIQDSLLLTFASLQNGRVIEINGWHIFFRRHQGLGMSPVECHGESGNDRFFGYTGAQPSIELADVLARAAIEDATARWDSHAPGVICDRPGSSQQGWGVCPPCGFALEARGGRAHCPSCRQSYPAPYRAYAYEQEPEGRCAGGRAGVQALAESVYAEVRRRVPSPGYEAVEAFAREFSSRLPGSHVRATPHAADAPVHFWVEYAGWLYDCDCRTGVERRQDLPHFQRFSVLVN